jgi:hypothetical protein
MRQMDALIQKYHAFLTPNRSASLTTTSLRGHPGIALKAGFADGPACEACDDHGMPNAECRMGLRSRSPLQPS